MALWILPAAALLCLLVMGLMLIQLGRAYRKYRKDGHPLPELDTEQMLFKERGASGKLIGRWGSASNVLIVAVSKKALYICPYLPWAIMESYWKLGLIHRIPIGRIRSAKLEGGRLGGGAVLVTFENEEGEVQCFRLHLEDPGRFRWALTAAGLKSEIVA